MAVGALALVFGGTALAAYDPSLLVAGTSHALNSGGPVVIGVGQNEDDDATGVITIYSPPGYRVSLGQAPGTQLGEVSGVVKIGALGGTRANVEGTVRADNPANYLTNPCSPGPHEAVWLLQLSLGGTAIPIPMYVDRVTAGAEAAYASARIRLCLRSPYVPEQQGGAASGASLLVAAFSVRGVFTNPGTRGSYAWQGQFVPYTPGTATVNPANAAQSMSITRLPVQLAVSARKVRRGKRRFARVTACITEAGEAVRGVNLTILGGRTARRVSRVGRGRTNARGCVTKLVRLRSRTTFFRASTSIPARNVTSSGCRPTLAPRCTAVALAPAFSLFSRNAVRVRR